MSRRWPLLCAAFLLLWWALLAIAPRYRASWLHENILVFASVPLLVLLYRRRWLSDSSWTLVTAALSIHLVGAHYTYSEVPLFDRLAGRNHYDRVVHFSFGLLMSAPIQELEQRHLRLSLRMSCVLAIEFIVAMSALYEMIEWGWTEEGK